VEDYDPPTKLGIVDMRRHTTRIVRLRKSYYARWPFWSPDGRHPAFIANGGNGPSYDVLPGGRTRLLARGVLGVGTRSHDWNRVVYVGRDRCLYVSASKGGRPRRLTTHPRGRLDSRAAWSWDDRWIAFTRSDARNYYSSLWIVRTDGTGLREVLRAG
jgi:Tol biopolymer transport system component